jgi:hypothetical protein
LSTALTSISQAHLSLLAIADSSLSYYFNFIRWTNHFYDPFSKSSFTPQPTSESNMQFSIISIAAVLSIAVAAPIDNTADIAGRHSNSQKLATEVGVNAQGQREFLQDGVFPIACGNGDVAVEPCVFVSAPTNNQPAGAATTPPSSPQTTATPKAAKMAKHPKVKKPNAIASCSSATTSTSTTDQLVTATPTCSPQAAATSKAAKRSKKLKAKKPNAAAPAATPASTSSQPATATATPAATPTAKTPLLR